MVTAFFMKSCLFISVTIKSKRQNSMMNKEERAEFKNLIIFAVEDYLKRSNQLLIPNKKWFRLKECCELKGINYRTACNKTYLQPNSGKNENILAGNKVFSRETLLEWLEKTDDDYEF